MEWAKEQDEAVLARQRLLTGTGARVNYGAIGGELTYSFTPMSVGTITKVTHAVTKAKLDLTDYDW